MAMEDYHYPMALIIEKGLQKYRYSLLDKRNVEFRSLTVTIYSDKMISLVNRVKRAGVTLRFFGNHKVIPTMSGPTTAIFVADPVSVLLSAAAIRASQAIYAGYENAANLRDEHESNRDRLNTKLKEASAAGHTALEAELKSAESEFHNIAELASRFVSVDKIMATLPARPKDKNESALATYARTLRELTQELRSILLTESAMRMDDLGQELITDLALAQPQDSHSKNAVLRLLSRIAHLGEIPVEITKVAKELEADPSLESERAKLLLNELRVQIQKRAESAHEQSVQEASALILQQSLRDLGYQVDDVSSTLFVEGGVVHFRRQGWDNYMVRMRLDPKTSTTNFNVIRAVETASNERSALDHLAEDRWCAEFPALLQALDVRGVHLNVTRRLEAGELPVQLVQKDKLPKFGNEESSVANKNLISREIK
jgi:hypothetical protein